MSKMSELFLQIEDLLNEDYTASEVANMLNIDIDMVYDVMDSLEERDIDCDDSDDGYALASAGWGTDEDYGYMDSY